MPRIRSASAHLEMRRQRSRICRRSASCSQRPGGPTLRSRRRVTRPHLRGLVDNWRSPASNRLLYFRCHAALTDANPTEARRSIRANPSALPRTNYTGDTGRAALGQRDQWSGNGKQYQPEIPCRHVPRSAAEDKVSIGAGRVGSGRDRRSPTSPRVTLSEVARRQETFVQKAIATPAAWPLELDGQHLQAAEHAAEPVLSLREVHRSMPSTVSPRWSCRCTSASPLRTDPIKIAIRLPWDSADLGLRSTRAGVERSDPLGDVLSISIGRPLVLPIVAAWISSPRRVWVLRISHADLVALTNSCAGSRRR